MSFILELKSFLQHGVIDINTPNRQSPVLKTVLSVDGDATCFVNDKQLTPELMSSHIQQVQQKQRRLLGATHSLRLLLHHFSHFVASCGAMYATYSTFIGHSWQHIALTLATALASSTILHQMLKTISAKAFKGMI
jgi:hypothetical protein